METEEDRYYQRLIVQRIGAIRKEPTQKWIDYHVRNLNLIIEEYYADHWRDDDSPQAEKTFGVRRVRLPSKCDCRRVGRIR